LLDIMLPGKNGDEIIKSLKEKNPVPVIVTSAVHDVRKKVDMFALGADDYITKPFHNEELLARISVRLRNNTSQGGESKLTYKDITIDKDDYSVICHGKQCDLSRLEFDLLAILMENIGRTCTKTSIYDRVWDYETSADDNALNVHISKLRKKLKECNPDEDYIETVWGIGYRLKK
ncbi:MAG: response regulator transcription factor, partial [Ruminococcus sp.]|nr:response regulator transcription factor [Ruminococcus sp.]